MIQKLRNFLYTRETPFSVICRLRTVAVSYGLFDMTACIRSNPVRRFVQLLLSVPFFIYVVLRLLLSDARKTQRIMKNDATAAFEHELVMITCIKNEADYMAEWIIYHHMQGVTKFFIYDNGSTDCPKEKLRPFIQGGLVELIDFPGECKQVSAFTDGIKRASDVARYAAFLDADEFLVTASPDETIADVVRDTLAHNPKAGGLAVGWLMFGSSHHKTRPVGLVTENYLYRADAAFMNNIKTIGNPRLMHSFSSPHYPHYMYAGYNVNENGKRIYGSLDFHKSTARIHINHYFTKSEAECMAKIAKGIATVGTPRTKRIFTERDRNEVYDDTILRYLPELKKRLNSLSD